MNNSNTQPPALVAVVRNQTPTMRPGIAKEITVDKTADCQFGLVEPLLVYHQHHPQIMMLGCLRDMYISVVNCKSIDCPILSAVTINSRKRRTFPYPEELLDPYSSSRDMPHLSTQLGLKHSKSSLEMVTNFSVLGRHFDPKRREPTWVYLRVYQTHPIGLERGLHTSSSPYLECETGWREEWKYPNFTSK